MISYKVAHLLMLVKICVHIITVYTVEASRWNQFIELPPTTLSIPCKEKKLMFYNIIYSLPPTKEQFQNFLNEFDSGSQLKCRSEILQIPTQILMPTLNKPKKYDLRMSSYGSPISSRHRKHHREEPSTVTIFQSDSRPLSLLLESIV